MNHPKANKEVLECSFSFVVWIDKAKHYPHLSEYPRMYPIPSMRYDEDPNFKGSWVKMPAYFMDRPWIRFKKVS